MEPTKSVAYLLTRLPIGMSFLGHGLVRIPKISAFAEGMANNFADTVLPNFLVLAFGYVLPLLELLLGILLLGGIAMRKLSAFGGCVCAYIWVQPDRKLVERVYPDVLRTLFCRAVPLGRL